MDKETKYIICTHNDLDGFCCGAILLNHYPETNIFFANSNSLHKVLYRIRHNLTKDCENHLIICDIALNGKKVNEINQALRYIRMKQNLDLKMTWIDHHKWPEEEFLINNFEKIVDSTKKTAAILVRNYVNADLYQEFVDLAQGYSSLNDREYWKRVIRNVCRTKLSEEKLYPVLRAFSQLKHTEETDQFNFIKRKLTGEDIKKIQIFKTTQSRKFAVLDLRDISYKIDLYKEVFHVSRIYNCDFICVVFENEEISCYNTRSVSFNFLKDYGAVGHLDKGAVHVPIPYENSGMFGFQRLLTVDDFIDILKNNL